MAIAEAPKQRTAEVMREPLRLERCFTTEGVHPYDEIQWERRDAIIPGEKGGPVFEQKDVEVPAFWSQTATNVVASKYFRGKLGTPARETSVRQMIDRVAKTIANWGRAGRYFASEEDAEIFEEELTWLLVNQHMAFNSPVWFNVGASGDRPPQAAACFILSVEDDMESILEWFQTEGRIFKGGSGSGVNVSTMRSSREHLSGGGTASGPVSFMRGADSVAGSIKSGGTTRRAAKMVILNVDHPDLREFIWCKAKEERKAWALGDAGYDMSLNGEAWGSIQFQNANNSVRATDDFVRAALADGDWKLKAVTTGDPLETVKARSLLRDIGEAAWECGDPGMQFDTTINDWHTLANTGRINGSNPCFPADARVHTTKGLIPFGDLFERTAAGEEFRVYTHRATAETPGEGVVATKPIAVMRTGVKEIVRLRFKNGTELRCTPNHRIWTTNRGYVHAEELTTKDEILLNDSPTPATDSWWELPVKVEALAVSGHRAERRIERALPTNWSEPLAELMGHQVGDGCVTDTSSVWVYGQDDVDDGLIEWHARMIAELFGASSRQHMDNGTWQLRVGSGAVRELLYGLGMTSARAYSKKVPYAILTAPAAVQSAFLRGLYGADGTVSLSQREKGSRYVGLSSSSQRLLKDVQGLLSAFGIRGRIYRTRAAAPGAFKYRRRDGTNVEYDARDQFDLRITGTDVQRFAERIGFSMRAKQRLLREYLDEFGTYESKRTTRLVSRDFDGQAVVYNLTEPLHHSYMVDGLIVANCSEYMSSDDSACNLASLNLMRFVHTDCEFDVERFRRAVQITITAQEVLVGNAGYPTKKIERNAKAQRQLGLGYANLGAVLMRRGLPYDSDEGRAYAAAITAVMTGEAYSQSARVAANPEIGPFEDYAKNREPMLRVVGKHREAAYRVTDDKVPAPLLSAARAAWDDALTLGGVYGFRNAQASVLAPTGTISFMLDCDTTGVEPDIALVKYKKLVGGGTLKLVNQTVPAALRRLGYTEKQVDAITAYIDARGTIEGAPELKGEHLAVFDCAFRAQNGARSISHMGHIKMMGAVQPFISGAISKCVTADTLLSTTQGLVRIGTLRLGERPDSYRPMDLRLVTFDGIRATDAFYYGGLRDVMEVRVRSGHRVTGTPNHRLLVADTEDGLVWRRLDELKAGDHVATQYGEDVWSSQPASLTGFQRSVAHGSQKVVRIPSAMTHDLAFFLGAYAAAGHVSRSNWTIHLSNADAEVLARLQALSQSVFGVSARVRRQPDRCPCVELASKTVVELLDDLACGDRASRKRIPDAVLRSPRSMVLAFLGGLSLDSYMPSNLPKWAICQESPRLLDDLQAVLTNLGIVHSRISKYNAKYHKSFDEVSAHGRQAQAFVRMLAFPEAHKRVRAAEIAAAELGDGTADIVPGLSGRDLYALLPKGRGGYPGRGTDVARRFSYLRDDRTTAVSRASLERVAAVPGIELPRPLRFVLERNLRFSPVVRVQAAGVQEVFDVSVPVTHAFVGNGIVNHNTVNLPETASVDDVMDAFVQAWRHGVKAIAIYRDGSKKTQPLSTSDANANEKKKAVETVYVEVAKPVRKRLPNTRVSLTHKFSIEGHECYITVGLFEDGRPGELFISMAKEGSTLSGMLDAFARSVSLLLQYGAPLSHLVEKFAHMRFEPSGWTGNPEIGMAKSIVDYVFRWMGLRFLSDDEKAYLGLVRETTPIADPGAQQALLDRVTTLLPQTAKTNGHGAGVSAEWKEGNALDAPAQPRRYNSTPDAPPCPTCGFLMIRNGTCHKCENCGSTSGCS